MDLQYAQGRTICTPPKAPAWLHKQFLLLGWGSSIPSNPEARRLYFEQFYEYLTVKNPYCPYEMPYSFVLPAFFHAIVTARLENVYPSVASLLAAFKAWIESNRKSIRQAWAAKDGGHYENPGAVHATYEKP